MKKIILLSMFLLYTIFSHAQTSEKKWALGLGIGAYGTLNETITGLMPEIYLGRYLSPRFDLVMKGNLKAYDFKIANNFELSNAFLNLRLKLSDKLPYFYAGPGLLAGKNESGVNFNLGFGSKIRICPAAALFFDAGYISGFESTVASDIIKNNLWKATVGMEFDLGKTKDSDMDGVSDKKDKCPDTPTGVAVDASGCPMDTDGDGIADYLDNCPAEAGLTALGGCPDKDKDGLADKDDACPDVAGAKSLNGCPDSDKDGIAEKDDKCPDTPQGVKVDMHGCPVDTDSDGIADYLDKCPSVQGTNDNKGCPKEPQKREITSDQIVIQNIIASPVHFVSGQSYLTDYSKNILEKLITILNGDKDNSVNMFGYTDSQGTDEDNIKLAQARVETVTEYLVSKGISAERIIHQKAFGEANPVASNDTNEGRLKNRRVEFEIFKMK